MPAKNPKIAVAEYSEELNMNDNLIIGGFLLLFAIALVVWRTRKGLDCMHEAIHRIENMQLTQGEMLAFMMDHLKVPVRCLDTHPHIKVEEESVPPPFKAWDERD